MTGLPSPLHTHSSGSRDAAGDGAPSALQARRTPVPASRSRLDQQAAERAAPPPSFPPEHLARGYLRGLGSPQPIGRPLSALAAGGGVMSNRGHQRRALLWARAVLTGAFIRRREEPAAALEAGDQLRVLQAPQQLGHGAPGLPPPPLPPPRQCPRLALSPPPLHSLARHSGRRAETAPGVCQQVRLSGPSARPPRAEAPVSASAPPRGLGRARALPTSASSELGGGAQVPEPRLWSHDRVATASRREHTCHLTGAAEHAWPRRSASCGAPADPLVTFLSLWSPG